MGYLRTYAKLTLTTLNPEQHARTCDYWYVIQENHGPFTAFNRRESLLQWLDERGLRLTAPLPEHGTWSHQCIDGAFNEEMHMSYDAFFALDGHRSRQLSNGRYTLAIITQDAAGMRTVHTLNPTCKDRPEFDYRESRAMFG